MSSLEAIAKRLEMGQIPGNSKKSDENSGGEYYANEIFLLEAPEGGDITEIRAVGFSGWPVTLKRKPTQPVRFYVQVIAFEDENAPHRNWQMATEKIKVKIYRDAQKLSNLLETYLK